MIIDRSKRGELGKKQKYPRIIIFEYNELKKIFFSYFFEFYSYNAIKYKNIH